eukprot:c16046_g1_i1 orf=112-1176(+)
MDLLGSFGNGRLGDALSLSFLHNSFSEANHQPTNKLRVFAAGSHIHITHIVFSASSFFDHIQPRRQLLRGQEIKSSNTIPQTRGSDLRGYDTFKLLSSLQFCSSSLGLFSSWFRGLGNSKHNDLKETRTTVALLGKSPNGNNTKGRFWTNVLIGLNVLMFVAQEASHGKLLLLGAKVNSLIDRGQVWRFLTPVFLHASLPHLLTNCYSLHSIGPVIEAQGGAGRFLVVYFGSAITGFILSYSFTRAPAVGASGAVFGLVGALAVYLLRHKDLLNGAQQGLSNLSRMIAINLALGLATSRIDNWGHLGGLVGGAAISWLVGPAFSYKRVPEERKMVLVDRPPISYLLPQTWRNEP